MNTLGWDTHGHMFLSLKVANRDPRGHILKSTDGTDTSKDESHHAADKVAVAPAGGLEGRPEVATQTTLARFAVVQKKGVGAAHPIVVEVVNDRNFEIKSSLIDRRGKGRKDVVYHPQIKTAFLLQTPKVYCDFAVVKGAKRKHELTTKRPTEKFLSRALIICHVMERE
jgi:hypothetical protein